MRKWGVIQRALFLGLAPASAIAALLLLYFTTERFEALEQALAERGLAIARQLAPGAEYGVFSGNRQVLQHLAEAALIEADVTAVTITDAQGAVLVHSGTPAADPKLAMPFSAPITMAQTALEPFLETSPNGEPRKTLGSVKVELSRASIMAKKKRLLVDTFFITLIGLFVTWVIAVRMSRGITHPILRLADTVERLGEGELSLRSETHSGGALGLLQAGVNRMAAGLQSAQSDLEARIREATAQLTEKRAEADRANLAKSRFLAAASHDLRQPVHALGLFVAELKARDLGPEPNTLAERIEAGVLALSDLLDSMLDISKLDAGAMPVRISHFSIGGILSRMEADFEPVAREKGLSFKIVPCRATVKSDPILLERIVLNLVANAVRYTNAGGILVGCRRRGQTLILQVWDTGVGIPENRHQYIFQEFYQLGNPERDQRKGLGLGLAIVERLAKLLDHRVELTSTCGVGSIFSVQIPMGEPQLVESAAPSRPLPASEFGGALLAIVDDDDLARASMEGLVKQWGCQTIAAASGNEALARLDGQVPAALVCDYRLPGGETGIEVITLIRVACSKEIPAILISGDTSPKLMRAADAAGFPLLHKPVRPAKLRALLTHLLKTRQRA